MELSILSLRIRALSVLRNLQKHSLIAAYLAVFDALKTDADHFAAAYGALCAQIFACGDVSQSILDAVHFDTNTLTDTLDVPAAALTYAATHDIQALNALLALDGNTVKSAAADIYRIPALRDLSDFPSAVPLPFRDGAALASFYRAQGYGFYAQASAFAVQEDGGTVPVVHPDPIRLSDLTGYARQKQQILQNTRAFLDGHTANNILLYGDKGTGKSSTVKAVAREYQERGLKIIELAPRHISFLPKIFEQTRRAPFHFIVFLDDLSFSHEDQNFAALKAFIEGGLAGRPSNLVIYATSNRRHLIRESFADRAGDDVRVRDSLETTTSLSDRFGLEITFSVPDKEEYLNIVDTLAAESRLSLPPDELHLLAERFALRRNGRSPRTARQFISQQLSEVYEKK